MFSWAKCTAAVSLLALAAAGAVSVQAAKEPAAAPAKGFEGIGRPATPAEVKAWDIDVRPDLLGLPPGKGSVMQGQEVWEAKCASCHGVFGESNSTFNPIVGGTTAADVKSGNVASLRDNAYPGRTTLMKLSTVSTLWDYIHRAMPWNAPKTLTVDEVYAVTAYVLNLGGIVGDDFTLSNANMAEVNALLPNRNGMTTAHAMWPGGGLPGSTAKPDVQGSSCMQGCDAPVAIKSSLPEFARNAHGNLADQNRFVGAQRGVATGPSEVASAAAATSTGAALAAQQQCMVCHGVDQALVGPAFRAVAAKYKGRADAPAYLAQRIREGGSGTWGTVPMPPQPQLKPEDVQALAQWIASGAP